MRKSITTTELLEQEPITESITVEPIDGVYQITYFLKERDENDESKIKIEKVENVIEDDDRLWDGDIEQVKHIGYVSYRYYKNPITKFYINLYRNPKSNPYKGYYKNESLEKGFMVILCSQTDFMGGEKKYPELELYKEYEIESIYFSGGFETEMIRLKGFDGEYESPDFEDINNPIGEMIITVDEHTCNRLSVDVLSEAYDILLGKDGYPNGYKAEKMRDIFDGGIKVAGDIWAFDRCLTYLRNVLTGKKQ